MDEAWVVGSALAVAVVQLGLLMPGPTATARGCREPQMLPGTATGSHEEEAPAVACDATGSGLPPVHGPARLLFGQGIDLNRAPARSLEVLPGIGPRRAAAIIRERQARRFESVESLRRVPGIGPRTIASLAGWVAVSEKPGSSAPREVGAETSGPR